MGRKNAGARWLGALTSALALSSTARADEPLRAELPQVRQAAPKAERNYGNLRVGASSASRRPELCAEVSPLARLGLEACGTGSGFLHRDPEPELAHFRAKLRLASFHSPLGFFEPAVALGFAELQVGEDGPGFHFGGTGPYGVETAGAELGASLRLIRAVGAGFDLLGELNLSAAYLPHAPKLLRPGAALAPSISFTFGAGF
jgi:hypothetical protein